MFEQWLEDAETVAYRVVLGMCPTRPDRDELAADASAQAILEVMQKGEGQFDGRDHLIRSVVVRARGRFLTEMTRRRRQKPLDAAPEAVDAAQSAESGAREREKKQVIEEAIQRAFSRIDPQCKEVLHLHFWDDLNDREVAEYLHPEQALDGDGPRQAARMERFRCLSDMRRILLADGIDPEWW